MSTFKREGPRGKEYEKKHLGLCPWQSDEYKNIMACVKEILRLGAQRGTKFTRKMCKELTKKLGCGIEDVEYYSAIDSPLDSFHGVDAFLIIWLDKKRAAGKIVTLDITLKPRKKHFKSKILITPRLKDDMDKLVEKIHFYYQNEKEIFFNNGRYTRT